MWLNTMVVNLNVGIYSSPMEHIDAYSTYSPFVAVKFLSRYESGEGGGWCQFFPIGPHKSVVFGWYFGSDE